MEEQVKYAEIGSVSHGTMREEDLIPIFLGLLKGLSEKGYYEFQDQWRDCLPHTGEEDVFDSDKFSEWLRRQDEENHGHMLHELFDLLGEFSPPYCYFGAHPGDGSDYGFWVDDHALDEAIHDEEVYKVDDLSELDNLTTGALDYEYIVYVNDHGNMSLYSIELEVKAKEMWSVV